MKLPKDDSQVELDHIMNLHRGQGMLRPHPHTLHEPIKGDYTAGDRHSGTGEGTPKTVKKPETY